MVSGTYRSRPPFGVGDLAVPVGSLDADLPLAEIDVAPLERDHLATPKARLPTQEHDEVRGRIERAAAATSRSYSSKS